MELPDSLRNLLTGNASDPGAAGSPSERSKQVDGGRIVAEGEQEISIQIPEDADVDREQIEAALSGRDGSVNIEGQAGGDSQVTPVASGTDIHITDSEFDLTRWQDSPFLDDRIVNFEKNRIDYNQTVAEWILAQDDLIPGILIRLKSLLLGDDGLRVEPEDPDSQADQRLKEHLEEVYAADSDHVEVDPQRVVDRVLEQNVMNAVWVGRSTDLQHLDVDDLSYIKDGETGQEVYIQQPTGYTTFSISDDGEPSLESDHTEESQALLIGEHVLDVRLYRNPPLEAVADDVVNKLQMKRFQGRKAEIASIGGIIIRVNPPAWLDEEDYDQFIREQDNEFGDSDGRLLELVMARQIEAALETLEDYQSATVMSIPENWEIETVELPEMNESMQDMIRGYNEAIARRLLLPLDLLELEKGSELSRSTMMQMFLNTMAGWQGQITDMFDGFGRIQADIHGIDGSVSHSLPQISAKDTQEILKLFNFAGLLGLSQSEARELANVLEGVDLDSDNSGVDMPEPGGPEDPEERQQQIDEMLEEQRNGQNQGPGTEEERDEPQGESGETTTRQSVSGDRSPNSSAEPPEGFPTTCRDCGDRTRMKGNFVCPQCHDDVDPDEYDGELAAALSDEGAIKHGQTGDPICWVCGDEAQVVNVTPPYEFACSHHGISPNHVAIDEADLDAAAAGLPDSWEEDDHVQAAHAFTGFRSAREAAAHVRTLIEQRTPNGYTGETKREGDDRFQILVFDTNGDFDGSLHVSRDPTRETRWMVTGGNRYFSDRRFEEVRDQRNSTEEPGE